MFRPLRGRPCVFTQWKFMRKKVHKSCKLQSNLSGWVEKNGGGASQSKQTSVKCNIPSAQFTFWRSLRLTKKVWRGRFSSWDVSWDLLQSWRFQSEFRVDRCLQFIAYLRVSQKKSNCKNSNSTNIFKSMVSINPLKVGLFLIWRRLPYPRIQTNLVCNAWNLWSLE